MESGDAVNGPDNIPGTPEFKMALDDWKTVGRKIWEYEKENGDDE
jgi:hypothetical protein